MKTVLLVDDDPVILQIYQDGLGRRGFRVESAPDGLAAVGRLRANPPDVVVLDLMMPKLSGVDTLKFIRADRRLAALPVIVLSNVYKNELVEQAVALGVQKVLLKTRCSPTALADVVNELLGGQTMPPAGGTAEISVPTAAIESAAPCGATDGLSQAQIDFRFHASATCADIRASCRAFVHAPDQVSRARCFGELCRRIHALTAAPGYAEFRDIKLLTDALDALLFELWEKPGLLNPAVVRTLVAAADLLPELCQRARAVASNVSFPSSVLIVDDDALSNLAVLAALAGARLQADSVESPAAALERLQEKRYDLLLLATVLPGLSGAELCSKARALPGYQHTPVIYVAAPTDDADADRRVPTGGNDVLVKPVFPLELTLKVVTHLLLSQRDPSASAE